MEVLFLSGYVLKLIAIVCMLIDHIGAVFNTSVFSLDTYWVLRYIGRVAFPVFCFLIVEGAVHTHNRKAYLLRLGFFALLSEIPFNLAFNDKLIYANSTNVYFTLFLGLLAITVTQVLLGDTPTGVAGNTVPSRYAVSPAENDAVPAGSDALSSIYSEIISRLRALPAQLRVCLSLFSALLCCMLAQLLDTDYSFGGVLIIYMMFLLRSKPLIRDVAMIILLYLFFGKVELYGGAAILLFYFYNGKRGPNPKWLQYLFYFFYPVHLLVLWLLDFLI
jgi:hypothetical protein